MLSGFKASVQNELNSFFATLANQTDMLRQVSAQAFSQARKKLSYRVFADINTRLLDLVQAHMHVPLWHGLRVVAADASKMQMFLQDATGRSVRETIAFALYLPSQEMTLAATLYEPSVAERQMLFEHLVCLAPNDLLVLDRGYPSRWLVALLTQRGIPFCIRADASGFSAVKSFLHSGQTEAVVTLRAPDTAVCKDYECAATPTQVRLIRVVTPNGRIHVVITSLMDASAYPAACFADLYHSRWRRGFQTTQASLALENTSGLSWLAARQDFGAKILADNLHAVAVIEATAINNTPDNYKLNRTYAFAHLKRSLPRWLLVTMPSTSQILATFAELAGNLIRFIQGSAKPRPTHLKPHRKHAYKSTT